MLKQGCKAIMKTVSDLTDKLGNGSSEIFFGQTGNEQTVDFPETGKVKIKRKTWNKRLETGSIEGTRKRFPVSAMYAITCHKLQRLTLPPVECSAL